MGALVASYGFETQKDTRARERAEALIESPSLAGRKIEDSSSLLLAFGLVRRPLLLVRRGAAGGDLLLLYLYGA